MRRNYAVDLTAFGNYTTHLIAEEASEIIQHHDQTKPLFAYVAHLCCHSANPHSPLQAPRETVEMFSFIEDMNRRRYAGLLRKIIHLTLVKAIDDFFSKGMVHELDKSVGRIVQALKDRDMLQNSIIVFSTDNGGPAAGFNQNAASNWPLKGVCD
jgi:arylsulfatase B